MRKTIIIIAQLFIVAACVRQPDSPNDGLSLNAESGVYILCEGLMGGSNSSLSFYDFNRNEVENRVFSRVNSGSDLGDLANGMVIKGDTIYIAVSTNKKIEAIRASTAQSLATIRFEGERRFPRQIEIVNDSVAFVTDLYDHSITKFNPSTFEVIGESVKVGPAPEGIASYGNMLFVANSGYGDYLADKPKAGTVSVLDLNSLTEIALLEGVPNVIELEVSEANAKLYARYNHLPKYKDSLGGIVEYDINTLLEIRRWRTNAYSIDLSADGNRLYFISDSGVKRIDLNESANPVLFIKNEDFNDNWYGLDISPRDGSIWISAAKNYQSSGEVIVYDSLSTPSVKYKFGVGLNPNSVVFF